METVKTEAAFAGRTIARLEHGTTFDGWPFVTITTTDAATFTALADGFQVFPEHRVHTAGVTL